MDEGLVVSVDCKGSTFQEALEVVDSTVDGQELPVEGAVFHLCR